MAKAKTTKTAKVKGKTGRTRAEMNARAHAEKRARDGTTETRAAASAAAETPGDAYAAFLSAHDALREDLEEARAGLVSGTLSGDAWKTAQARVAYIKERMRANRVAYFSARQSSAAPPAVGARTRGGD